MRKDVERMRSKYKHRAPRFQIQTQVQYRGSGESDWYEGTTINMSRSGVLFHAANDLKPKTKLEMRILFPSEDPPANVICWGRIVRKEPPHAPDPRPAVAAAILRYRFMREEILDTLGL